MASPSNIDPLALRFQQPDLRQLLDRLVARLRCGRPLTGHLRLNNPSEQERQAVAALIGSGYSRSSGRSLSIDLDELAVLATRGGRFASLRHFVETACGEPIENERDRRIAENDAWAALWQELLARCGQSAALGRWIGELKSRGWVRRRLGDDPATARRFFDGVFPVLDRMPFTPPIALSRLAAEFFGDSHALDGDTDRGRLLVRGAAVLAGHELPRTAADVRAAWSAVGVVPDELSATALVLNLPTRPGTALGEVLALHRGQGEPCRVTFRQLRLAQDLRLGDESGKAIFVCENPSVVAAAADRWGADCRPLISVEGQPNLTAEQLLRVARDQGFLLRYHGDFDWGGVRIAARIWKQFHFLPWRFDSQHYLAAPHGRRLKGPPVDTPWDTELRATMEQIGAAVHEEAVLTDLLADLSD